MTDGTDGSATVQLLDTDNKTKKLYFHRMAEKISHKRTIEFEEDFFALTVLCYLKQTKRELMIT
jgi:hypothetical protein